MKGETVVRFGFRSRFLFSPGFLRGLSVRDLVFRGLRVGDLLFSGLCELTGNLLLRDLLGGDFFLRDLLCRLSGVVLPEDVFSRVVLRRVAFALGRNLLPFPFLIRFRFLLPFLIAGTARGGHAVEACRLPTSLEMIELVAAARFARGRFSTGFRCHLRGGAGPEDRDDGVAGDPVRACDLRGVLGIEGVACERLPARAAHGDHALEHLVGGHDDDGIAFQFERLGYGAGPGGR